MSRQNVMMLASYLTAHTDDDEEADAIGQTVMNKAIDSMFNGNLSDSIPPLEGEVKEKFFKILNGRIEKESESLLKKNIVRASSIMLGRKKDRTEGATNFSPNKVRGAFQTKNYSFYKDALPESVNSGKLKSSIRRKKIKG